MTPQEIALTLDLLIKLTSAAPGFLAALTGEKDDEAALEAARLRLEAIPHSPASIGISRRRAELAFQNSQIDLVTTLHRAIGRAEATRAAIVSIEADEGEALIPLAEAKRTRDETIRAIAAAPRTLSRDEVRALMKEGETIGEALEKRFTAMERPTASDKDRAK